MFNNMFNNKKIKQLNRDLLETDLYIEERLEQLEDLIELLADRLGLEVKYCDGCGEPIIREYDLDE